jgi:hypothetical protein
VRVRVRVRVKEDEDEDSLEALVVMKEAKWQPMASSQVGILPRLPAYLQGTQAGSMHTCKLGPISPAEHDKTLAQN